MGWLYYENSRVGHVPTQLKIILASIFQYRVIIQRILINRHTSGNISMWGLDSNLKVSLHYLNYIFTSFSEKRCKIITHFSVEFHKLYFPMEKYVQITLNLKVRRIKSVKSLINLDVEPKFFVHFHNEIFRSFRATLNFVQIIWRLVHFISLYIITDSPT